MKPGPRQIIGLSAIILFGSLLGWRLLRPKPDPMMLPSGVSLRDLPSPAPATSTTSPAMTVRFAEDPLTIGSVDAQADLYCSGLIFAAHRAGDPAAALDTQTRRDYVVALAEAGVARLVAEGAAQKDATAGIADAQANAAEADFAEKTPRIALTACIARAAAISAPHVQQ